MRLKIRTKPKMPNRPKHLQRFVVLVTGSRDWQDETAIMREIQTLMEEHKLGPNQLLVVEGEADGADTLTRQLCTDEMGIACAGFHAPWEFMRKAGNARAAGPMRNGWMLSWMKPDYVLAFHPYLPGSKGTKNCVEQARKLGIPIKVVPK